MREAQDVATADAGQPAGAGDEQEAQRSHAADQVGIGAFARARFGRREGVELEAAGEIVGQDAELLQLDTLRSEEHTSELQSRLHLVCRLLLEKKKKNNSQYPVSI